MCFFLTLDFEKYSEPFDRSLFHIKKELKYMYKYRKQKKIQTFDFLRKENDQKAFLIKMKTIYIQLENNKQKNKEQNISDDILFWRSFIEQKMCCVVQLFHKSVQNTQTHFHAEMLELEKKFVEVYRNERRLEVLFCFCYANKHIIIQMHSKWVPQRKQNERKLLSFAKRKR